MIRILHGYIGRELLKATGLSLVPFTLVMTIFAIIEPMRGQGLAPAQIAALFGYTLPVMLSLTLPIAALFAATIVYGRFSQDNELMACRASGLSVLTLLKPALLLGALVTVVSLGLNSYVSPRIVEMGERAAMANVRGIVYGQLSGEENARFRRGLIRAEEVYEDHDVLRGMVVAQFNRPGDVEFYLARQTHLDFLTEGDKVRIKPNMRHVHVVMTAEQSVGWQQTADLGYWPLPDVVQEHPSWYDWSRLMEIHRHPRKHPEIRRDMESVQEQLLHALAVRRVADAINDDGEYAELGDERNLYVIKAARAEWDGGESVRLFGDDDRLEVQVIRDGRLYQLVTAERADIVAHKPDEDLAGAMDRETRSQIGIELRRNVQVQTHLEDGEFDTHRREGWAIGGLEIPRDIVAEAEPRSLEHLYQLTEQTLDADRAEQALSRLRHRSPRLLNRILAEMHTRMAYGISCFLLVAMGAALGLVFRGGEIISAFALSVVPAALVIVLVVMGKQLMTSRDVPVSVGIVVIWSGIVALIIGDLCIYYYLKRR